ncbi:MAG: bifunctional precorrin-2 dehydrogenase/sirohydrochlorin ferrochelatase [Anaerolineales bacterium]|nr:bifunctional precorrin-2 dehydrogenase/sirohydrochlorin ferrochelatase [Anaerolineales bacterium]
MTTYYPVYIQLENQPCIVIGGGKIAEGKVEGLLEAGAVVEVISPALTPRLHELVSQRKIKYHERAYRAGDLAGAFMVICATNIPAVNQQVWNEANENHQLVNVVDDTPRCNFIAPAILRNGDLTIAISTSGKAPALAVRLKEKIQKQIGPENARFLEIAGQLREPLAKHIPDFETRKKLWYEIVDSDVLQLIADGNEQAALEIISQTVGFEFTPES